MTRNAIAWAGRGIVVMILLSMWLQHVLRTPPRAPVAPPVVLSPAEREVLVRELATRRAKLLDRQEFYAAGMATEDEVEDAELAILDTRKALGELGGAPYHRARADVLAKRVYRLDRYVLVGRVPREEADLAKLDLAHERALAGDPSDYAATREPVLAASAKARQAMVTTGLMPAADAAAAGAALERRFPPLQGDAPR